MKQFRFSTRMAALTLALAMAFSLAACSGRGAESEPSSSGPSSSKGGIPAFINPLGEVDLSACLLYTSRCV